MAGDHEAVVGDDVRGRNAQLAAALVAAHDLALQHERAAEEARRPAPRRRPRPGRGCGVEETRLALDLDQRHDARLELVVRAQELGRALAPLPEAEVLADRHAAGARAAPPAPRRRTRSALREANSRSNGITTSSSTPSPAIRSRLIGRQSSSFGSASGWITASGCGSKVSTVSLPRMTSRWPRWTPSNVPTATLRGAALGSRTGSSGSRVTFTGEHYDGLHSSGEHYDGLSRRPGLGHREQLAVGGQPTGPSPAPATLHAVRDLRRLRRRRARARAGTRAPPPAARRARGRRPPAGTARSPCARAPRSRRRRGRRPAGARRCPAEHSISNSARSPVVARAARPGTRSPGAPRPPGLPPARLL